MFRGLKEEESGSACFIRRSGSSRLIRRSGSSRLICPSGSRGDGFNQLNHVVNEVLERMACDHEIAIVRVTRMCSSMAYRCLCCGGDGVGGGAARGRLPHQTHTEGRFSDVQDWVVMNRPTAQILVAGVCTREIMLACMSVAGLGTRLSWLTALKYSCLKVSVR